MTQDSTERELQFEAADLEAVDGWIRAQPRHAQLGFHHGSDKVQRDTYLDTTDWALHRGGFSLRLRRKGETAEATLKALSKSKNGLASRREITQTLANASSSLESEAGDVASRVRTMTAGKPLRPLFEIVNRRRIIDIERDSVGVAEISLDDAQVIVDGVTRRTFSRVEIEETASGGIEQAGSFIDALRDACELTPSEISKFELGLLTAELHPEQAFGLGYAELSAEASSGEYVYAYLRKLCMSMLKHEPGTRLGEDPEELHDMRVATRRLRAAMSTFRAVLPARFERVRAELKWLAAALGEVRDVEVQIEWLDEVQRASGWEDATAIGPLIEERREHWSVERVKLMVALDSERYGTLVDDLTSMLREGDEGQGEAATPVRQYGRTILKKRYQQFEAEAAALTPESDAHLYHLARIRAKKLRYTAEALTEVFGEPAAQLVTSIKAAQDLLGEHQDRVVAIGWLRATALADRAWPTLTLVRLGELAEGSRYRMTELRREWPEVFGGVEKQWRALRRATRKRGHGQGEERRKKNAVEAPPPPPAVAVQRPLSIFRRFFPRG